jgi:hypothetical protein
VHISLISQQVKWLKTEIRDFPKAVTTVDNDILSLVLRGLKNCINLKSCIWTRDGSLNSEFLKALQCCENLRGLEFNGHNDGHYDARLLLGFTNLERILIIMPSPVVVSQIKPWLSITGPTLRSFTLICKVSSTTCFRTKPRGSWLPYLAL